MTIVGLTVAALGGGFLATQAQATEMVPGIPGVFIADADITDAPDGAVVGKGWNGQDVSINCQSPDGNWWHLNAPGEVGWVWQPGQVLPEYGQPHHPPVC